MSVPAITHLPAGRVASAEAPAPALLRFLAAVVAYLRAWHTERLTLAMIAQMDAATLKDLGASRWELAAHVRAAQDRRAAFLLAWRGEA
jgi:uncharacterized protein YjiS (DUF1127 family)